MIGKKKIITAAVVLVLLAATFAGIWIGTRRAPNAGGKAITVEVVHSDDSHKTFTYRTDAEYLGEVLLAEGLIAGDQGEFGLYITAVDGESASWDEDGAYWALYEGDDYAAQGADQTVIRDGDAFSLVYTVG